MDHVHSLPLASRARTRGFFTMRPLRCLHRKVESLLQKKHRRLTGSSAMVYRLHVQARLPLLDERKCCDKFSELSCGDDVAQCLLAL